MQHFTGNRFPKKAVFLTLFYCTLLQAFCTVLRIVFEYFINGNLHYAAMQTVIPTVLEFIGSIATFSGFAVVAYLVFLYGIRRGGEMTILLAVGYALVVFLVFYIGKLSFGFVSTALVAAVLVCVFLSWIKGGREVAVTVLLSFFLPYIGGIVILFSTTVVSAESLLSSLMYGFLNFGMDLLLLIIVARIAGIFRTRAIRRAGGSADISLGGRFLPGKNPVLNTFLTVDVLYTALALVQYIRNSVADISDYGLPVNGQEWANLIFPYLMLGIYFVLGYAVMAFVASRFEASFRASEEPEKEDPRPAPRR